MAERRSISQLALGGVASLTTWAPFRSTAIGACALLAASPFGDAYAAPRKSRHVAPPAISRDIENETTSTIPAKTTPPSGAAGANLAKQDDEPLAPPFRLPDASRKRMRDCGQKWQAMKMSGEAGDDIWRIFATHCLAATSGPFEAAVPR